MIASDCRKHQVPVAGKVVSLYTAYGALITHLVNTTMDVGSYTKRIDLKAMNIPQGTYLIKVLLSRKFRNESLDYSPSLKSLLNTTQKSTIL